MRPLATAAPCEVSTAKVVLGSDPARSSVQVVAVTSDQGQTL
jgi:hypothetical protein